MSFSEKIKKEVREKSRHCCVFCKKFFLPTEVHHIIPEALGGSDAIENAVLLCRNHHTQFGHNPHFIEYIQQERDKWYVHCDKYMADSDKMSKQIEEMDERIKGLEEKQKTSSIEMTKEMLTNGIDALIKNLQDIKKSLDKKEITPTDISTASLYMSGQAVNADYLGSYGISSINADVESPPTYSNPSKCPACKTPFHDTAPDVCPRCGLPLKLYY